MTAFRGAAAYDSAKGAVIGLTESSAVDRARTGSGGERIAALYVPPDKDVSVMRVERPTHRGHPLGPIWRGREAGPARHYLVPPSRPRRLRRTPFPVDGALERHTAGGHGAGVTTRAGDHRTLHHSKQHRETSVFSRKVLLGIDAGTHTRPIVCDFSSAVTCLSSFLCILTHRGTAS